MAILTWSGPMTDYDILASEDVPLFRGGAATSRANQCQLGDLVGPDELRRVGEDRPDTFRIASDGCSQTLPPKQSCAVQVVPPVSANLGEISAQRVIQALNAPVHLLSADIGGFVVFWAFDAKLAGT